MEKRIVFALMANVVLLTISANASNAQPPAGTVNPEYAQLKGGRCEAKGGGPKAPLEYNEDTGDWNCPSEFADVGDRQIVVRITVQFIW